MKGYKANIRLLITIDLMIGNYPYPNLMTHTPSMPAYNYNDIIIMIRIFFVQYSHTSCVFDRCGLQLVRQNIIETQSFKARSTDWTEASILFLVECDT